MLALYPLVSFILLNQLYFLSCEHTQPLAELEEGGTEAALRAPEATPAPPARSPGGV